MELLFATGNLHKAQEVRDLLGSHFQIKTLKDLAFSGDIAETGITLEENACIKARSGFELFGKPTFADDTGLEVLALQNAPGVFSARYAGANATYKENCDLLLKNMEHIPDRTAVFKTVFCFVDQHGNTVYFKGEVEGTITRDFRGDQGFGYDPVFLPLGLAKTFAEMSLPEKNKMSHRAKAVSNLVQYLRITYTDIA